MGSLTQCSLEPDARLAIFGRQQQLKPDRMSEQCCQICTHTDMRCDHFVPPPMHMKPIKVLVDEPVPKSENMSSAFEETIFLLELLREQKKEEPTRGQG